MIQTAQCVVEFEAPEDATPEQLEEAAYEAELPTLCHQCADTRNQSLDISGEWELYRDEDGQAEIAVDEDGGRR
ncbi:hypothetical protein [Streptomyces longwoodensis]|uniref:hypothetical protein n=1 Tax=Streptomyces longwoodensis TaxID=68231 RepID=UPI0036ED2A20